MHLFTRYALLFALVLGIATPAAAQSFLYAVLIEGYRFGFAPLGPTTLVELDITNGRVGGIRRTVSVPGARFSGPVVTADGRFVVWTVGTPNPNQGAPLPPYRVVLFDRLSGATSLTGIEANGTLIADPSRNRVAAVSMSTGIASIINADGSTRPITFPASTTGGGIIAPDGSRLYVSSAGRLDGFDMETGASVVNWLLPSTFGASASALTRDGSRLYAAIAPVGGQQQLRIFDTSGGAPGTAVDLPSGTSARSLSVEDSTGWLVAALSFSSPYFGGRLMGFDGTTLNPVFDGGARVLNFHAFIDPSNSTLTLAGMEMPPLGDGACNNPRVETWQLNPLAELSALAAGYAGDCGAFVLASPPSAPSLAVTVSGRTVSFSWTHHAAGAIGFSLEAGSAPGLTNVARFTVQGTSQSVSNVPPGTYYVRLRGINAVGTGAASNDVTVTVQ